MNDYFEITETVKKVEKIIKKLIDKGPIKVCSKNKNNLGYIIENEFGIEKNELPIADYQGIEIKSVYERSIYPLKLFSCEFDGPNIFESKVLLLKFSNNDNNKFNHSFMGNKTTIISNNIYSRLFVDNTNKRIHILFFDNYNRCVDNAYWDYDTIIKRINNKLKNIVIVYYKYDYINNEKHYKITRYKILKIKNINTFIDLIKSGEIIISFSIEKKENGSIHNHGINFSIKKENILKLYDFY